MKQISQRFYMQGQSWNFERIVEQAGRKLRVAIRRNAYDDQSSVHGYALDPLQLKWNLLVDRPIMGAACQKASYVRSNEPIAPFEQDAKSVLEELAKILA